MRGKRFYFLVFFGLTGVLLLNSPLAHAGKNPADIQHELAFKKAAHQELLRKSNTLNSQVNTLKNDLVRLSKDLRESEESLSSTDQNLKELRQKKEECLKNLYKDHAAMGGLVSAVNKYSHTSTPARLIQSRPLDAARASMIMKSMMPRIQQQSAYLQGQLAEIKKIESQITDQLEIQTRQNKKLNKQQDTLQALLEERRSVYQVTESERMVQEKEVARLTRESRNIEELITKLHSKDKPAGGEKTATRLPSGMIFPVHGKIYTAFGEKDDLGAASKGITFSTKPGASVIVPLAGTVKFAGPFQKFKQILIVEHRGGYHSLIAGLERIDTVVGASLAAGEPIGVTGTGSPQIYYELRQNGKPINPQKSLVAQRKQEKS